MTSAVIADRLIFWPKISKPEIITIIKPHTEYKIDPNALNVQELKDCVASPIDIKIGLSDIHNSYAMINVEAGDKCKYARAQYQINYPIYDYKNIIGVSAGILKTDRVRLIYSAEYSRKIWENIFFGGQIIAEKKKIIGGMASGKLVF